MARRGHRWSQTGTAVSDGHPALGLSSFLLVHAQVDLTSLCKGTVGAQAVSGELVRRVVDPEGVTSSASAPDAVKRMGTGGLAVAHLTVAYGLTETGSICAMSDAEDPFDAVCGSVGCMLVRGGQGVSEPEKNQELVQSSEFWSGVYCFDAAYANKQNESTIQVRFQ